MHTGLIIFSAASSGQGSSEHKPVKVSTTNQIIKPCFCGASITLPNPDGSSWLVDEILWQREHSAQYRASVKDWSIEHYARWANGNQGYKWATWFKFSEKSNCATCDDCGHTVSIYDSCIRTAGLGNIMYGFIGHYLGFQLPELTGIIDFYKLLTFPGAKDKSIHHEQYKVGYMLSEQIGKAKRQELSAALAAHLPGLLKQYPEALEEAKSEGGTRSFQACKICTTPTPEKHHGGNGQEYMHSDPPPPNGPYSK